MGMGYERSEPEGFGEFVGERVAGEMGILSENPFRISDGALVPVRDVLDRQKKSGFW